MSQRKVLSLATWEPSHTFSMTAIWEMPYSIFFTFDFKSEIQVRKQAKKQKNRQTGLRVSFLIEEISNLVKLLFDLIGRQILMTPDFAKDVTIKSGSSMY